MKPRPIGPRTVTILGSHWPASWPWGGLHFDRAELNSQDGDYCLRVPWMHPHDYARHHADPHSWAIYRARLKRGIDRFERINGVWMVTRGERVAPETVATFLEIPDA